jgi:Flp pilus assembly protein CpaB
MLTNRIINSKSFVFVIGALFGAGVLASCLWAFGAIGQRRLPGEPTNGPVAAAPAAPEIDSRVALVATHDLEPGVAITPNDLRVRELTPHERYVPFLNPKVGALLPTNPAAITSLVPIEKIFADVPLRQDMLRPGEPVTVLVASEDLYPGVAISTNNVRIREVTQAELADGFLRIN